MYQRFILLYDVVNLGKSRQGLLKICRNRGSEFDEREGTIGKNVPGTPTLLQVLHSRVRSISTPRILKLGMSRRNFVFIGNIKRRQMCRYVQLPHAVLYTMCTLQAVRRFYRSE